MNEIANPTPAPVPARVVLSPIERRVIGTLIEKGLSNPQYYPMTLNLLESGCNQKNNRDPLTNYSESEIEDCCKQLQDRGLVAHLFPSTGRVGRWRQEFGRLFQVNAIELAVIGELLLRGPQTEGELRQRASRMREIASLEDLDALILKLSQSAPRFVVRLTPEGVQRGVRVTHGCYPDAEIDALLAAERSGAPLALAAAPRTLAAEAERAMPPSVVAELRERIAALEARISALETRSS